MRLINVKTLELHEFFDVQIPRYAILSHRWTDDEISYKDFVKGRRKDSKGYRKIADFCSFVLRHDGRYWCDWAWVDTVCIDKRSSAELSEAINSMYDWYAKARICYVYLADVEVPQGKSDEQLLEDFERSEWFKRGWTLQELLANGYVVFLASDWSILGSKVYLPVFEAIMARWSANTILQAIARTTTIPTAALLYTESVRTQYSVAQRMSWAANRQTTRSEDIAYCLLGLLGINMPLLYGEGDRAFQRLQHEIIRQSHDESIYAWEYPHRSYSRPILAPSPAAFANAGDIVRIPEPPRFPWTMTHHGLEIPMEEATTVYSFRTGVTVTRIALACRRSGSDVGCKIVVCKMSCGHWGRLRSDTLDHQLDATKYSSETSILDKPRIYVHTGDDCEDMGLVA